MASDETNSYLMYNYGDMDWAVRAPRFVLFIVTVSNVGGGGGGGGEGS